MKNKYLEHRILTGLIVSNRYISRVRKFFDITLLESPLSRRVSAWCLDYYDRYGKVPDSDIEAIFVENLEKKKITKDDGDYIGLILKEISNEYDRDEEFNDSYLYDQTIEYFRNRKIEIHNAEVEDLNRQGRIEEAEKLIYEFKTGEFGEINLGLELSSKQAQEEMEKAFEDAHCDQLIYYPGALGDLWNRHLSRGSFVAFLAPEKRGKSFLLLELGMRAIRKKMNVAFFQAGDMTKKQQLRRIGVYLTRNPIEESQCETYYRGVGDCLLNQLDICNRSDRNCDHGIIDGFDDFDSFKKRINDYITKENLLKKFHEYKDYEPCDSHLCDERIGSLWFKEVSNLEPLKPKKAKKELASFFRKYKRRFKLITYPNDTLSVGEIRRVLHEWEKQENFIPDVILIDYADLLTSDLKADYRHKIDSIWKNMRALSQEKHCLVITATQSDSASYKKDNLSLDNFSEDKRKYAHVTAMYGLNQDRYGREKKLGLMRINELVIREGEFSINNQVTVIQDLRIARPFLESYVEKSRIKQIKNDDVE